MGKITLSTPAKVLKVAVGKFVQITSEVWKGFNRESVLYTQAGADCVPCKGDQILLVKIDGTGKYIAISTLNVSQGAKEGEVILYARDGASNIASTLSMLQDGSVKTKALKDITTETQAKNTVKGSFVEINGNAVITGGSFKAAGTAAPTGTGCLCGCQYCYVTGSPVASEQSEGN